jgi:hypothetical protein
MAGTGGGPWPSLTQIATILTNIATGIQSLVSILTKSLPVFEPGQLPGTATNDNADPGNVGEFGTANVAQGSAVSISTGTPKTVVSMSLTAGDWDAWGMIGIVPAAGTTVSQIGAGISETANTLPAATDPSYLNHEWTFTTADVQQMPVGQTRISLATTSTIYLVISCTFAVSTNAAFGTLAARRAR